MPKLNVGQTNVNVITAFQAALAAPRNDIEQSFTEEQKLQVRSNIGAGSQTDTTALQTRMTTAENELDVLDSRMDEFASLPDGSTAGNAELLDIRIGFNGKTWPSAGDAVRGQATELDNSIKEISNSVYPTQASPQSIWEQGSLNSSSGANSTGQNRIRTKTYISSSIVSVSVNDGYKYMIFAWDSTDTYIGVWNGTSFAKSGTWLTTETRFAGLPSNYKYRLLLANTANTNITTEVCVNLFFGHDVVSQLFAEIDNKVDIDGTAQVVPQNTTFFEQGVNVFNGNLHVGYCNKSGGHNYTDTAYRFTDEIKIGNARSFCIAYWDNGVKTPAQTRFICAFDENGDALPNYGFERVGSDFAIVTLDQSVASIVVTIPVEYTANLVISLNGYLPQKYVSGEYILKDKYNTVIADTFNTATNYAVGDYVLYQGVLYRYLSAHTAGTWDITEVTQINVAEVLQTLASASSGVLAGKKWVACGDSFTHGDFSNAPVDNYHIENGIYAGEYKVYPYLIGNRTGMLIVNEAVNGSTLTHIDGRTNAFSDIRYTQIPADADYITIKIGINDDSSHQNVPIGTIDDNTNETFYGAWNIVLDYLIRNHPQAKIGIIVTNGAKQNTVDATIAAATKWGIPYLNEATDNQCSYMFRSLRTDVNTAIKTFRNEQWYVSNVEGSKNYHPNALAHEFESTVVEAWLRTL